MNSLHLPLAILLSVGVLSPWTVVSEEEDEERIPFHGPNVRPGYPDAFHLHYWLGRNAVSPNQQFGVIYPRPLSEESSPANFIVNVPQSRILGALELDPHFPGKGWGGLTVHWSPDSSALLVESGGKWEPRDFVAIDLADGKVRQTNLLDRLEKMFLPAVAKAERIAAKEAALGELVIDRVVWKRTGARQAEIKCRGGTNPKDFPTASAWKGELVATWDFAQWKFTASRVKQTSFRKAQVEE